MTDEIQSLGGSIVIRLSLTRNGVNARHRP